MNYIRRIYIDKKNFADMARPGVCEVCGRVTDVVVASSTFGPCTNTYCEECLADGLEPYSEVVGLVWCIGWDDLATWAKDKIERTLKKLGKTKEDVMADVEATEKEFLEWAEKNKEE